MAMRLTSPYLAPDFYARAIADGRHRDIVGGRWDETGRVQMQILHEAGLGPADHLLDIGAGALRLGCKAVPYLQPGHYWATDASLALMRHGRAVELPDPDRLPDSNLIEDSHFALPGVPDTITLAIAFGVFTHLPAPMLDAVLLSLRLRCPALRAFLVTVFVADDNAGASVRQPDGVVTHSDRPPYHRRAMDVASCAERAGFTVSWPGTMLPRGQRLAVATPANQREGNSQTPSAHHDPIL